jgi:hypothetical protein
MAALVAAIQSFLDPRTKSGGDDGEPTGTTTVQALVRQLTDTQT